MVGHYRVVHRLKSEPLLTSCTVAPDVIDHDVEYPFIVAKWRKRGVNQIFRIEYNPT